jgi:hypothetical protein
MKWTRGAGTTLGVLCAAALVAGCDDGGAAPGQGPGWGQITASAPAGRTPQDGQGPAADPATPTGPAPGPSGASGTSGDIKEGGRLVVTTDNGVRLRPTGGGRAAFRGDVRGSWSRHDGTWVLDLSCPDGGSCSRMPTVEVPDRTAVTVSARNAGIDVAGLTGDLNLTTVNGDVTSTGVGSSAASVALTTRNGSVRATGLVAASLAATTVNGDVVLGCDDAPASVNALTTNGSVGLTVPRGAPAYRVDAVTRNGQSRVDLPKTPDGKDTLTLRTVNGDITASNGP